MAYYKYSQLLSQENGTEFDVIHHPGVKMANEGDPDRRRSGSHPKGIYNR
jgi:hypothetical protein